MSSCRTMYCSSCPLAVAVSGSVDCTRVRSANCEHATMQAYDRTAHVDASQLWTAAASRAGLSPVSNDVVVQGHVRLLHSSDDFAAASCCVVAIIGAYKHAWHVSCCVAACGACSTRPACLFSGRQDRCAPKWYLRRNLVGANLSCQIGYQKHQTEHQNRMADMLYRPSRLCTLLRLCPSCIMYTTSMPFVPPCADHSKPCPHRWR